MNASPPRPPVICLMGPTAVGKTEVALQLVERHPFQIISVDSVQVYRGMDIGTGKPDPATLRRTPHRLVNVRDPAEPWSAASFRRDALAEIQDVLAQGSVPLLVGGTMLYFKVLRDGLADLPDADPRVRADITAVAARHGWKEVHRRLAVADLETAGRIHPNDPQRLQRAMEVWLLTGKSMSRLHRQTRRSGPDANDPAALPFDLHFLAMQPPSRSVLYERIEQRFRRMLQSGFIDEVRYLYNRGDLHSLLPSVKAVGYRQAWQYLAGDLSFDDMVEKSIIATRQLAKRQLTWLRGWNSLQHLNAAPDESVQSVLNYVDAIPE